MVCQISFRLYFIAGIRSGFIVHFLMLTFFRDRNRFSGTSSADLIRDDQERLNRTGKQILFYSFSGFKPELPPLR